MGRVVHPNDVSPVSGFLTLANGTRSRGYYAGIFVVLLIWSVTPAAWATVAWQTYRKGTPFALPTSNIHAKIWYLYSLAELPFSIYFRYLTIISARRPPPPAVGIETLHNLLTKSLTVGLKPLDDEEEGEGKVLRNGKSVGSGAGVSSADGFLAVHSEPASSRASFTSQATTVSTPASSTRGRGLETLQSKRIEEAEASQRRRNLRSWFFFCPIEDIWEDNIREWLAWAFAARHLDEAMQDPQSAELINEGLEMVKLRLRWPDVKPGYNPNCRAIRLTLDPIRTLNRPLGFYIVTNYVSMATIAYLRFVRGFKYEQRGRCQFLVKPAEAGSSKKSLPIVFLHGLGIGLGQYMAFLYKLAGHRDGVVILIQPHISTNIFSPYFLNPAGKDEQAQATVDVLRSYNMHRVTTLSHSNGTMVLGWLLRTAPEMFVRNILVDPVSFCMWEGSVCYSFIHRPWASMVEALLGYCVGRELGTAYTIGRRFIWFDMILWVEEFPSLAKENLHIIFAERDILVDVPGSIAYLRDGGVEDECITIMKNYNHGQALIEYGEGMKIALKQAGLRA